MKPDEFIVPDDPAKMRDLVDVLMSELKSRDIRITDLEQRLAGMNRHRFGTRSENADQLNLTLENAEIAATVETAGRETDGAAFWELPLLRQRHAAHRRGCDGRAGIHPRPLCSEPDCPPQVHLPRL